MKTLLEIGPLAIFFIAYKFAPNEETALINATIYLVIATIIALSISWFRDRHIPAAPLISAILVVVFGGMTVALDDPLFIKLKPTIVNLLFAGILLGAGYFFRKGLLQFLLEAAMKMDDENWRILSIRWGYFFIFLAMVNEIIWRSFSEEFWMHFKVFGMLPLTITFALSQMPFMLKNKIDD